MVTLTPRGNDEEWKGLEEILTLGHGISLDVEGGRRSGGVNVL